MTEQAPGDLAARMYPALATAPATPTAEPESTEAARTDEVAHVGIDDLVARDLDQADRIYVDGADRPESSDGYHAKLGEVFDHLEQSARFDGNEANTTALADGRRESAALLHELQVPRDEAGEIARTIGQWVGKPPQSEDAAWDRKLSTLAELERDWGKETKARVQLAQRTAVEAAKRLPWLGDLLRAGAGNDPALIRRFAEIGLRQARRARR